METLRRRELRKGVCPRCGKGGVARRRYREGCRLLKCRVCGWTKQLGKS